MRRSAASERDFESRVAHSETCRDAVIIGFGAAHGKRHSSVLRHDFDASIWTSFAFVGRRPKRRLLTVAREHKRTRFAAKLLVLARIMEGNFEHEGRPIAGAF